MTNQRNRRVTAWRGLVTGSVILALCAASMLAYGGRDVRALGTPSASTSDTQATGNWNFERGDLSGWHTRSRGSGAWYAYADGTNRRIRPRLTPTSRSTCPNRRKDVTPR